MKRLKIQCKTSTKDLNLQYNKHSSTAETYTQKITQDRTPLSLNCWPLTLGNSKLNSSPGDHSNFGYRAHLPMMEDRQAKSLSLCMRA